MVNLKYLDDESNDGMEVRIFPSLEELMLCDLPNIEGLLKVERREMFPCLSKLRIYSCPKFGRLPCLPSLKDLVVWGCNNELLRSISTFCSLTTLDLQTGDEGITSFPEGMLINLTFLQTLKISGFPKLKELPNEPFNLALDHLDISYCKELENHFLTKLLKHLLSELSQYLHVCNALDMLWNVRMLLNIYRLCLCHSFCVRQCYLIKLCPLLFMKSIKIPMQFSAPEEVLLNADPFR
ncbi:hypothetical protein P8452_43756 [Trifolium repens]|nr:hypothetical protein P8452_43756 [Trifolium repens]